MPARTPQTSSQLRSLVECPQGRAGESSRAVEPCRVEPISGRPDVSSNPLLYCQALERSVESNLSASRASMEPNQCKQRSSKGTRRLSNRVAGRSRKGLVFTFPFREVEYTSLGSPKRCRARDTEARCRAKAHSVRGRARRSRSWPRHCGNWWRHRQPPGRSTTARSRVRRGACASRARSELCGFRETDIEDSCLIRLVR